MGQRKGAVVEFFSVHDEESTWTMAFFLSAFLRAIEFHQGDKVGEEALKALIRAAVTLNKSSARG